jgi:hypothetical protein
MIERIVLIEGYHDRAFIQGLLEKCFGCVEDRTAIPEIKWKANGVYKLRAKEKDGALISYGPVHGNDFSKTLRAIASEAQRKPLDMVIVIRDTDLEEGLTDEQKSAGYQTNLDLLFADAVKSGTRCVSLLWSSAEVSSNLLPQKQTLERLVCGAVKVAYPSRLNQVRAFLDSRSGTLPENKGKEEAMSLMAGWHSNAGPDPFYRLIWNDESIRTALISHLTTQGLWPHFEALAK